MMLKFKISLLIILGFCLPQTIQAEPHYNAWFRSTLSVSPHAKFKLDAEWQHRRQNGYNNSNMLDKSLLLSYRTWVHYQHNEGIVFSISPIAYFSNKSIINKPLDEDASYRNEIRFSAAATLQHKLLEKLHIVDRAAIEYRIFEHVQPNITRLRNRLGLKYDFSEKIKLSVYEELLVNLSGTTPDHFLDHERLAVQVDYTLSPHLKIDIGYLHINRLPLNNPSKITEHNIFLNLRYQLHTGSKNLSS